MARRGDAADQGYETPDTSDAPGINVGFGDGDSRSWGKLNPAFALPDTSANPPLLPLDAQAAALRNAGHSVRLTGNSPSLPGDGLGSVGDNRIIEISTGMRPTPVRGSE